MKKWFVVYTKVNQGSKYRPTYRFGDKKAIVAACRNIRIEKKIKKPHDAYLMINLDKKNRNDVLWHQELFVVLLYWKAS